MCFPQFSKSGLGVTEIARDDTGHHSYDMKELGFFETLSGRQQQLQLATHVVKMILRSDDIITLA